MMGDDEEVREQIDPAEAMRRELADIMADLRRHRMPFGKYQGRGIHTLPYEYLHWFVERQGGFPTGRLGELMEFVYHTKSNGAEVIFAALERER